MECPKCGYNLQPFDDDCPRCKRQAGQAAKQPPVQVPTPDPVDPQAQPSAYGAPTMMADPAPISATPAYLDYAGFWLRVVPAFADGIILGIVSFGIAKIMGINLLAGKAAMSSSQSMAYNIVSTIIGLAYFAGFESSSMQATPGKMALGLIVTDLDGNRITPARALLRYVGRIISSMICGIGYIMAGFTEKKQALHDLIAGTLVIKS